MTIIYGKQEYEMFYAEAVQPHNALIVNMNDGSEQIYTDVSNVNKRGVYKEDSLRNVSLCFNHIMYQPMEQKEDGSVMYDKMADCYTEICNSEITSFTIVQTPQIPIIKSGNPNAATPPVVGEVADA